VAMVHVLSMTSAPWSTCHGWRFPTSYVPPATTMDESSAASSDRGHRRGGAVGRRSVHDGGPLAPGARHPNLPRGERRSDDGPDAEAR
jgi:hypothetical protein